MLSMVLTVLLVLAASEDQQGDAWFGGAVTDPGCEW